MQYPTFSQWLRLRIEERLLTQRAFAERAEIPLNTLACWLAGRSRPRGVNVVRIARALGVNRTEVQAHLDMSGETTNAA